MNDNKNVETNNQANNQEEKGKNKTIFKSIIWSTLLLLFIAVIVLNIDNFKKMVQLDYLITFDDVYLKISRSADDNPIYYTDDSYAKFKYTKLDPFVFSKALKDLGVRLSNDDKRFVLHVCAVKRNNSLKDVLVVTRESWLHDHVKKLISLGIVSKANFLDGNKIVFFQKGFESVDKKFFEYIEEHKEYFSSGTGNYFEALFQDMVITKKLKNIEGEMKLTIKYPFQYFIHGKLDSVITASFENKSFQVQHKEDGIPSTFFIENSHIKKILMEDKWIYPLHDGNNVQVPNNGEKYLLSIPSFECIYANGHSFQKNEKKIFERSIPREYILSLIKELKKDEKLF